MGKIEEQENNLTIGFGKYHSGLFGRNVEKLSVNPDNDQRILDDLKNILSDEQYEILKYKIEGFMNVEIAKFLKLCPATIGKRIKVIKNIIKEYIENGHS